MSIREALLRAFEGRPGRLISGATLAHELNISRVAVWKHINTLKDLGIPLESTQRSGYRLVVPADSSLAKFTGTKRAWAIPHYFLNTHSTQTLAKEGGMAGLPEGHLWIAETQSRGRGRLERLWESAYGGLWFSLLLRPPVPPSRIPPLTLLAGLCLRNAIAKICGVDAKLKWPNDLIVPSPQPRQDYRRVAGSLATSPDMHGGRGRGRAAGEGSFKKLAGILTEMSGQMDRTDWVVIGVGLNVNNTISKGLAELATSLYKVTGKPWKRAEILRAFLDDFRPSYRRFQSLGFEPFQVRYWSHYGGRQKPVRLQTARGMISGIARGVDASGAIMIESRRKIHTISEGEIAL